MNVRELFQQVMEYDMDYKVNVVIDGEYTEFAGTTEARDDYGQRVIELKLD